MTLPELWNQVLTTGVLTGATFAALRTARSAQAQRISYEQAGLCARCKGTGVQKCQLCYGKGSIAKPGYVNVVDPKNRVACCRCDQTGMHSCGACSGTGRSGSGNAAASMDNRLLGPMRASASLQKKRNADLSEPLNDFSAIRKRLDSQIPPMPPPDPPQPPQF